jgi:hypothetical protein
MDVREAVNYRTWKVGVELKLGTFQLDQSNKVSKLPFQKMTTTTPTKVCQDGVAPTMSGVKGWEEMDLYTTLSGIVKIENERWHHQPMRPKSTTVPQPTNNKPTPKKAVQATGPPPPSKAEMFMQSRPGGQLETKGNEMKGVERRVSLYTAVVSLRQEERGGRLLGTHQNRCELNKGAHRGTNVVPIIV